MTGLHGRARPKTSSSSSYSKHCRLLLALDSACWLSLMSFFVGDSQYFPARKVQASDYCKYFESICFFWPIHSSAFIESEDPLHHHDRILFVFPDVGFDPLARLIQVALLRIRQLFSVPMAQRCAESDFFALHLRTLDQSLLARISIAITAFQVFIPLNLHIILRDTP